MRENGENEKECEKKVSLKNWYVTSCGWPRCRDVIDEALVHFPL